MKFRWLVLAGFLALPACSSTTDIDDIATIEVFETTVPCVGMAPQECLLVRLSQGTQPVLFYDAIEGFDYEPGFRYLITVRARSVRNPPADGSSVRYTLVREEARVATPHAALLAQVDAAETLWRENGPLPYEVVMERTCECPAAESGTVHVQVAGYPGWPTRFEQVQTTIRPNGAVVPVAYRSLFGSVQDMFRLIRWAIVADAGVSAQYHGSMGYPTSLNLDYNPARQDDDVGYVIHSVTGP
jgi:hypothetical protein